MVKLDALTTQTLKLGGCKVKYYLIYARIFKGRKAIIGSLMIYYFKEPK